MRPIHPNPMNFFSTILIIHNGLRWIILLVLAIAVMRAWRGWIAKRDWASREDQLIVAFAWFFTAQFALGATLYGLPNGLAAAARIAASHSLSAALSVRELRFFGLEHPLQMIIALGVAHLGKARVRRAAHAPTKWRWAIGTYAVVALLIVSAIPWWRPLLRLP